MPTLKTKKILKAAREKQLVTDMGAHIRLSTDSSPEILQARRSWNRISIDMKSKDLQSILLYTTKYHLELKDR